MENSKLAHYQRLGKFTNENTAYQEAGIGMIQILHEEVKKLKKG